MKHTYGGLELDLGHTAWFRDFKAVPIFHRWAAAGRTACGLTIWKDGHATSTGIPARHAVRFARPCRRCWPELLGRPTLFARPRRSPHDGSTLLELTGTTAEDHA